MTRNTIIPYNPELRVRARELRDNSTFGEILLWNQIKKRKLGVQFYRQVPIDYFIVDFYCHELQLAVEVDGSVHNSPHHQTKDIKRQYRIEQFGVRFIRIYDFDVKKNMDSVIQFLKHRIKELTE
jgi:very-short-patch-repair endonuclease